MIPKIKQLQKDSFIYGFGGALSRSIQLIALPLFTRIFTPSEYALIDMLTIVNGFLASTINLGLHMAQTVYFFEEKENGMHAQKEVVTSIFQLKIIWGLTIVLICTLLSPVFNVVFFESRLTWEYFLLAFTGSLFIQVSAQSANLLRLLFCPWRYTIITGLQSFGSMAIAVVVILIFDIGILGVIIGTLIGSIFSAAMGSWMVRNYIDFSKWYSNLWPQLIRFGFPLIPCAFALWLMTSLDRILIMNIMGSEAMGIYAVGIKFAAVLSLIVGAIRQAWLPIAMDAIQTEEGKDLLRHASSVYLGVGLIVAIIITLFAPMAIEHLAPKEYFGSYEIVGMLTLYHVFYGYLLISQLGLLKNKKTYSMTIIAIICALINLGVSYTLIPILGILGAAIGTTAAIILRNLLSQVLSQKHYPVNFNNKLLVFQFILALTTIVYISLNGVTTNTVFLSSLSIAFIIIQTYKEYKVINK